MPEPARIRNVAVVGHRGTGKTSLVEALLFQSGAAIGSGTGRRDRDRERETEAREAPSVLARAVES